MSNFGDIITETRSPDITRYQDYENILELLANDNSLTYNYALSETIRLMENLASCSEEEINDMKVIDFASRAAKYLSDYRLTYYHESTIAQLELLLQALSSVLHVLSLSSNLIIQSDIRSSIYKSVSNFWSAYRKTKFTNGNTNANIINANIIFRLREIRNCLCGRIKDDQSGAETVLQKSTKVFDAVVSVLQKEYFAAFGSFVKIWDFEYSMGEWFYDWEDKREKYYVLRRHHLENSLEINNFYKELYKSSRKEFDKVLRKNTKYRNFEYKVLKSGGVATGNSLPDNIDTLLIGYLHLIQQLLEEQKIFSQIDKKYFRKTIKLCTNMVEVHVKKQLTFKALEVLFVIRHISESDVAFEIDSNIERWYNLNPTPEMYSQRPLSSHPRSLSSPAYFPSRSLSSPAYFPSRPLSSPLYIPSPQYKPDDFPLTTSPTSFKFDVPPTPTSARTSISNPPPTPTPTSTPSSTLPRRGKQQKRISLYSVREIPTKVQTSFSSFQIRYPRKRIIDNVEKLFKERSAIAKEINEINELKEKYDELEKDESIDTSALLLKFKEMLDERKSENNFSREAVKYIDKEIITRDIIYLPQPQPLKNDDNDIVNESFLLKLKDILKENMMEIRNNDNRPDNPQREDLDDNRKGVEGSVSGSESDIHDEINNNNDEINNINDEINNNNKDEIINNNKADDNKDEVDNITDEIDNNNDEVDNITDGIDNNNDEVDNIVDGIDNNNEVDNNKDIENIDNNKDDNDNEVDNIIDEVDHNKDIENIDINKDEVDNIVDGIDNNNEVDNIIDEVDNNKDIENENIDNNKDDNVDEPHSEEKEEIKEVEDIHDVKSPEQIEEIKDIEVEINADAENAEINTNAVDNSQKEIGIEAETDNIKQDEKIPDIIVYDDNEQVEINPHLNEQTDKKNDNPNPAIVVINHFTTTTNTTTTTQPTQQVDDEGSNLIRRALKKIVELVESVEYIADRAAKGRQDALRLSNNVSSTSVNEINENEKKEVNEEEKEVEKVEEEKIVEKVEGEEKVVEKVEEVKVVEITQSS